MNSVIIKNFKISKLFHFFLIFGPEASEGPDKERVHIRVFTA